MILTPLALLNFPYHTYYSSYTFYTSYSSGWILNLGVVPLLRFCFFLLAPFFLVLLALRVFVTRVRETIIHLSFLFLLTLVITLQRYKRRFLPAKAHLVKIFLQFFNFLTLLLICSMASSTTQAADKRSSLILSKGEVRELSLPHLQKFTLGSSEVLSGKYLAEKGKLMIKGLKVGYSELVVWEKAGGATHIPVYVLPKIEHLKLIHLQEFFQKIHLSLESHGPLMVVKGQVKTLEHYHLLKKIAKKYSETHTLHLQVHLNRSLRNTLLGEIYLVLFSGYAQHVRCHFQFLEIFCHYQEESGPKELALKSLQETYDVHFIQEENPKTRINYKIRMKLVQMEKTGGEDLHWGLNPLSAPLEDLFTIGLQGILLKNEFLLKKENVVLSTLAEPEVVIQLGRPVLLEMGQQIPVSSFIASPTTSTSLTHRHETHWKFAGLKVKLLLKQKNGQLNLHYETEFTRPSQEQNIVGNRESSSLAVELNHPYQLFQIGHKSEGQETSSLPWPGPLSFLGQIFASRSQHSSYKRIYGLMTLEEFSP